MKTISYKRFRTEMTLKGFIIRGGEKAMVIFTPRARLELNQQEDGSYIVYNFTTDETHADLKTLDNVMDYTFKNVDKVDIYSWYSSDWRVSFKGNSLYNIGQLVDGGEAEKEDVALALQICDEMKYLILMSDYIPDEMKNALCKDVGEVKESFEKLLK